MKEKRVTKYKQIARLKKVIPIKNNTQKMVNSQKRKVGKISVNK